MSLVTSVADAITAALNSAGAGTFDLTFTAARHYRPLFDLEDLKTLHLSVVPKGIEITSLGRNSNQHDVSIDVAVQQKVDPDDQAALDGLMEVVQQIIDYMRLQRLATLPAAMLIRIENAPVYAAEHLEQMRVFTSVLTLTYRVIQ